MTEERYTLEEAAAILARRECLQYGHDLEEEMARTDWSGRKVFLGKIRCTRCHTIFEEKR